MSSADERSPDEVVPPAPLDQDDTGEETPPDVSDEAETSDRLPYIGKGTRWYDLPYRSLWWLTSKWRRKLLPMRLREKLWLAVNDLLMYHEHDRNRAGLGIDRHFTFEVPEGERVAQPRVWVLEFFPPSSLPALEKAIRREGWDAEHSLTARETNREILRQSRSRGGWSWWRVAEIVSRDAGWVTAIRRSERLPDPFRVIELKAIQIGAGLTAVVGEFVLRDSATMALDDTWRSDHQPTLVRRPGRRMQAWGIRQSAIHSTQLAREVAHDAAREWMAEHVPGFFAQAKEPHTVVDMLLTEKLDPLESGEPPREQSEVYDALGLSEYHFYQFTSSELPKFRLMPTRGSRTYGMKHGRQTWALWAQREAAANAASHLDMYGTDIAHALASRYDEVVEWFILRLGVSDFLHVVESRYAKIRDRARVTHGRFSVRAVEELREMLLTISLDLTSAHRDIQEWNDARSAYREAEFVMEPTPAESERREREGHKPLEPESFSARLREQQDQAFERLLAADRDYRDILSTVSTLGASADSTRLGRRALYVALASLGVALVTLVATEPARMAWEWLTSAR